jgi:methylated-DNA-[protein]-cysteine S-methyltransferase
MTSYSILKTPVGGLILVANESELIGIYFPDYAHLPAAQKDWKFDENHPVLKQAARELREYFEGKRSTGEIAKIPRGETISYSELAKKAGAPKAIRAAGTATGRNPLCIVVPCHRVLAKGGGIGGYGGGLERKRYLLELERKIKG